MTSAPSTAATLRAARALIDTPEKWCQGTYYSGGRYCAAGAIRKVTGIGDEQFPILEVLNDALPHFTSILEFNDSPATTHADVLAAFDAAIRLAEGEAQ